MADIWIIKVHDGWIYIHFPSSIPPLIHFSRNLFYSHFGYYFWFFIFNHLWDELMCILCEKTGHKSWQLKNHFVWSKQIKQMKIEVDSYTSTVLEKLGPKSYFLSSLLFFL